MYPVDLDKGPAPFHAGDYPYIAEHPNHGVPEEHWDNDQTFPVIIDYCPETGYAEWWPPMMCGPPPSSAPWSHPDAAKTMTRMEMFKLQEEWLLSVY